MTDRSLIGKKRKAESDTPVASPPPDTKHNVPLDDEVITDPPEHQWIAAKRAIFLRDLTKFIKASEETYPITNPIAHVKYGKETIWTIGIDRHSLIEEFMTDNTLVERRYYINALWYGLESWYPNGKRKYKTDCMAGVNHGWKEQWYDNEKNTLEFRGRWWNGRPVGTHKMWTENKTLVEHATYNTRGILVGVHSIWYPDGTPKSQKCYNDSGQTHGVSRLWHKNGKPEMMCSYNANEMHGWYERLDDAGIVQFSGGFRDGAGHGYLTYHRLGIDNEWYWYGESVTESMFAERSAGRLADIAAIVKKPTVAQIIDDYL